MSAVQSAYEKPAGALSSFEWLRAGNFSKFSTAIFAVMGWMALSEMGSYFENLKISALHEVATPGVGAILGRALTIVPVLRHGWRAHALTQSAGLATAAYFTAFDFETQTVADRIWAGDENWFIGSDPHEGLYRRLALSYICGLAAPNAAHLSGALLIKLIERWHRK